MSTTGWKAIFVDDDSTDGTALLVLGIARVDPRVRVISRIGRRGLSSACVEGMLASSAPVLAVMDADLQHAETRLPAMLAAIEKDGANMALTTRYSGGGSTGQWDQARERMSRFANRLSHIALKQPVSDPTSGFFMLRRDILDKMYTYRERLDCESKIDSTALWDFGMLLADKTIGRFVPVRFVSFAIVGGLGVFVHMAALTASLKGLGLNFLTGQAIAKGTAMVFNFAVNNVLTYRDQRLYGWRWWTGLASFVVASSIGAVANVGVANYLFLGKTQWALAALAGVAVGALWNYAITQVYLVVAGRRDETGVRTDRSGHRGNVPSGKTPLIAIPVRRKNFPLIAVVTN